MLASRPLALPAIFSLAGPGPEDQAVIERLEHHAEVHEGPQIAANHWLGPMPRARPRGTDSAGRSGGHSARPATAAHRAAVFHVGPSRQRQSRQKAL